MQPPKLIGRDVPDVEGGIEQRLSLNSRALGYIEKVRRVAVRFPCEAFCNIAHGRHRRPAKLIFQTKISLQRTLRARLVDFTYKLPCLLPSLNIFKSLYRRHSRPSVLRLQTARLMTERLGRDSNDFEISFEFPIRDGALELADLPVAGANVVVNELVSEQLPGRRTLLELLGRFLESPWERGSVALVSIPTARLGRR